MQQSSYCEAGRAADHLADAALQYMLMGATGMHTMSYSILVPGLVLEYALVDWLTGVDDHAAFMPSLVMPGVRYGCRADGFKS